MVKARIKGQRVASFEHELELWFFLGVMQQRWKDRNRPVQTEKTV
jgi:hypothetical protein